MPDLFKYFTNFELNDKIDKKKDLNKSSLSILFNDYRFKVMFFNKNVCRSMSDKKCAFTLAETLITLVIVGVVAALTVPNMIVNYQKEQTVTRLKKVYSTLSQTTLKAVADNGPMKTWEVGENNNPDSAIAFCNKYILPYLSVKDKPKTSEAGHWNNKVHYLNGEERIFDNSWVQFTLADGATVTSRLDKSAYNRLLIEVDINGNKKPNRTGRDIFEYSYYVSWEEQPSVVGKMLPTGLYKTREQLLSPSDYYGCGKNTTGNACAAVIMKDGWKISDDYPW